MAARLVVRLEWMFGGHLGRSMGGGSGAGLAEQKSSQEMKAPPFFTLGTVFLGVATSALGFLRGTSAEQEAGGGEERFGRHHPRHTFYCEHSATGDSVDQVLSGHITIFRPIVCETTQVVHVMAGKSLTLWSHGVLSTSNVHFVVHKDATLILESKEGIDLRRHESSSRALIMVAGKVVINWPTRLVSLFDEAAINYAYVWKMTRLPVQDVDVHEPINSSSMPTSTTSTIPTLNDWDDDAEDVFGEDGESAVVDEATCSPALTTPTTNRDDTAVPFPPRNEAPEGDVTEQLVCDDLKGENEGEEENGVEKENGGEEEEKNEKDEKEDEEEKEGEESQEEQDGEVRRCEEHVVSPLCVYDVLLRGKVTSASGRPEVCPATDEAVMFDHFEPGTLLYTAEQEIGQSMSEDEEEEEGEKDNEDEDADKKEEEEDEDADKKDEEEGEKKEDEDAEKKDEKEKEGGGGGEGGGEGRKRSGGMGGRRRKRMRATVSAKLRMPPSKWAMFFAGSLCQQAETPRCGPPPTGH
eukprot:jgi/Undpi1/13790/HiC_scaffold_9.g03441.m1